MVATFNLTVFRNYDGVLLDRDSDELLPFSRHCKVGTNVGKKRWRVGRNQVFATIIDLEEEEERANVPLLTFSSNCLVTGYGAKNRSGKVRKGITSLP